jgi:tetratricopeptide (TPR) repeat protein
MQQRQYQQAATAFRRVTEIEPERAEGYTNLASALYLLKDYSGTAKALEKVAALQEDTAGTYFLRAITLDKLGQQRPALENYQRFLASDEKKNPDQEFQARQRSQILSRDLKIRGR